ncbi:unnamed protein product [Amoebophrya sp. A25]|nr:unnamed protein product [Amoebophrya sp. A25]|eukprot:GSA25T00019777001.1
MGLICEQKLAGLEQELKQLQDEIYGEDRKPDKDDEEGGDNSENRTQLDVVDDEFIEEIGGKPLLPGSRNYEKAKGKASSTSAIQKQQKKREEELEKEIKETQLKAAKAFWRTVLVLEKYWKAIPEEEMEIKRIVKVSTNYTVSPSVRDMLTRVAEPGKDYVFWLSRSFENDPLEALGKMVEKYESGQERDWDEEMKLIEAILQQIVSDQQRSNLVAMISGPGYAKENKDAYGELTPLFPDKARRRIVEGHDFQMIVTYAMAKYYIHRSGYLHFLPESYVITKRAEKPGEEDEVVYGSKGDTNTTRRAPFQLGAEPVLVQVPLSGSYLKVAADLHDGNAVLLAANSFLKGTNGFPENPIKSAPYLEEAVQIHGRIGARMQLFHILTAVGQQNSVDVSCEMVKHLAAVSFDMEPVSRLMFALASRVANVGSQGDDKAVAEGMPGHMKIGAALLFSLLSETGHTIATENAIHLMTEMPIGVTFLPASYGKGGGTRGRQSTSRSSTNYTSSTTAGSSAAARMEDPQEQDDDIVVLPLPVWRGTYCCPSGDCTPERTGWLMNEGGHTFHTCMKLCESDLKCSFVTFYDSGYCQLSASCAKREVAGDPSAKTFRMLELNTPGTPRSRSSASTPISAGTIFMLQGCGQKSCFLQPRFCAGQLASRIGSRELASTAYDRGGFLQLATNWYCLNQDLPPGLNLKQEEDADSDDSDEGEDEQKKILLTQLQTLTIPNSQVALKEKLLCAYGRAEEGTHLFHAVKTTLGTLDWMTDRSKPMPDDWSELSITTLSLSRIVITLVRHFLRHCRSRVDEDSVTNFFGSLLGLGDDIYFRTSMLGLRSVWRRHLSPLLVYGLPAGAFPPIECNIASFIQATDLKHYPKVAQKFRKNKSKVEMAINVFLIGALLMYCVVVPLVCLHCARRLGRKSRGVGRIVGRRMQAVWTRLTGRDGGHQGQ